MEFVNLPLLAASALVFASVLTGLFSARIGLSFLLIFLLAGILAGEDGIGGYRFDDFLLSFWVGNVALGRDPARRRLAHGLRHLPHRAAAGVAAGHRRRAGVRGHHRPGRRLALRPGLAHRTAARRDRRLHRRGGGVRAADALRGDAQRTRRRDARDRIRRQRSDGGLSDAGIHRAARPRCAQPRRQGRHWRSRSCSSSAWAR